MKAHSRVPPRFSNESFYRFCRICDNSTQPAQPPMRFFLQPHSRLPASAFRDEGRDILIVARTDARQAEGLEEALWRVQVSPTPQPCL